MCVLALGATRHFWITGQYIWDCDLLRCHRLVGMTIVEHPLDRACSLMAGACDQLTSHGGYAASSAVVRCHEVIALLQECGAAGAHSVQEHGSVEETLGAVAEILDDIPPAQRPPRLGAARAELAGLALALDDATR